MVRKIEVMLEICFVNVDALRSKRVSKPRLNYVHVHKRSCINSIIKCRFYQPVVA